MEFVSVRQGDESETAVTVTRERAEALGLEVLDQPAVDKNRRPLGPRPVVSEPAVEPEELKGQALDAALESAGLSKGGSVDEKRARLADHQAGDGQNGGAL